MHIHTNTHTHVHANASSTDLLSVFIQHFFKNVAEYPEAADSVLARTFSKKVSILVNPSNYRSPSLFAISIEHNPGNIAFKLKMSDSDQSCLILGETSYK